MAARHFNPLPKDITGQRFSRLVVLQTLPGTGKIRPRCVCRCDCEAVVTVLKASLTRGATQSCGCQGRENLLAANITHGKTGTPEHKVWCWIKDRCLNPNSRIYRYYGGRGIKICDRWLKFENFLADMGQRPSPEHEIDRFPDNNGNYEPGNCRWATRSQNVRNTRANRLLTCRGVTRPLVEWGEITGLGSGLIHRRLKIGWTVQQALETPPLKGMACRNWRQTLQPG